jgi:hypothetical protein
VPKGPKGKPPLVAKTADASSAKIKRKRLNAKEKRERKAAGWQLFVKHVGRKAQRGCEPNDRKHSKEADIALRRIRAEDFDRLVRDGEDD